MKPTLVVMVRAPVAGRVKTRLGREIGMVPAAWWARHRIARIARDLEDPRWRLVLAVTPDRAVWSSGLPALPRIPQGSGNLGDRMARVFRGRPGPVLIVGADIPALTRAHVAEGFRALRRSDTVLGPAPDGGYWAIGLKRTRPLPRGLFEGVRWSSEHAFLDTLVTLSGLSTRLLAELHDVDTAEDLRTVSR